MGEYDPKRQELANYLSEINREIERRSSASSQSVKVSIASINEKNKIKNKRLMLKAREKERKSQMMMRGRKKEKDPFTRAITAPQIESFGGGVDDIEAQKAKKKEEEERRKKEERERATNRAKMEEEEMNNLSLLNVVKKERNGSLDAAGDDRVSQERSGALIEGDTLWATAVHDVAKEFVAQCQIIDLDSGHQGAPPQFGRNTNPSKYGVAYTKRPDALRIITIDDYKEKFKYK